MKTTKTYKTLHTIAAILSYVDNRNLLEQSFMSSKVNWDHIVVVASQHLMLPAIYCQLKRKNLLSYIPIELNDYLHEITSINRNRNTSLMQQAKEVSAIFLNANIDFVFIKGAAILSHLTTEDIGARMVGDLDIIIAPNQIDRAFKLLEEHGYTENFSFNYNPINFRHLATQVNPNKIGAIELHNEVLVHKHRALINPIKLLKNKQLLHGLQVPSNIDSIKIAIFTRQLNDHAHLYGNFNFKTIYDCFILDLRNKPTLFKTLSAQPFANSFLELSSIYFIEMKPIASTRYAKFLRNYYAFKLKHPRLGTRCHQLLYTIHGLIDRIKLFICNNSYRAHILKNKLHLKKIEN